MLTRNQEKQDEEMSVHDRSENTAAQLQQQDILAKSQEDHPMPQLHYNSQFQTGALDGPPSQSEQLKYTNQPKSNVEGSGQAADPKAGAPRQRLSKVKPHDDPLTFNFDRPENAPPTSSALNSRELTAVYRHRQVERLLQDTKKEVAMPSIQRMQRTMRIDSSVQVLDDKMVQALTDYLRAVERIGPAGLFESGQAAAGNEEQARLGREVKMLGRRAARSCVEVCEKGRCLQLWEILADFVFNITRSKIESIIAKAESAD